VTIYVINFKFLKMVENVLYFFYQGSMVVYIVVYEYKGVLIIVFDGRWDRWVERASLG
jgi:hypothetical protein